jgi:hypothetical protein
MEMIRQLIIATALLGAAPAAAAVPRIQPGETVIPRMSHFLEWLPDGQRGLFIRGDTGRWYYARLETDCPRLNSGPHIRFDASPSDRLDRFSAIRADGWRCQIASIVETETPPAAQRTPHTH